MIKILKNILFEPLLHFLVLGGLLYLFYASKNDVSLQKNIDKTVYLQKKSDESNVSILFRVYNEVLLQEAYNLELEKQDPLISKRLISQMQFILQGSKRFEEPSEEVLYKYYQENITEYSKVKSLSFYLLRFNSEKNKDFKQTEEIINAIPKANFKSAKYYKNQTRAMLRENFGGYYSKVILQLHSERWSKAMAFNGVVYLLYINKKELSTPIDFDSVEERVYRDYKLEFMRRVRENAYEKLLKSYKVVLE